MEQDLRYLRDRQRVRELWGGDGRRWGADAPVRGYRIMGGLFGGARPEAPPGAPPQAGAGPGSMGQGADPAEGGPGSNAQSFPPITQQAPQYPHAQPPLDQGQQASLPRGSEAQSEPPAVEAVPYRPPDPPRAVARPMPDAPPPEPLHQAIFFPLFVMLFCCR